MKHNKIIYKTASKKPYEEALGTIRDTAAGKDALGRVSPGEIGWTAAGAAGGGLLGYVLSRIHSKRKRGRDLAYVLLGAAAGGGLVQKRLSMPDKALDGTWRDKLRLSSALPELALPPGGQAYMEGTAGLFDRNRLKRVTGSWGTLAGGLGGMWQWSRGKKLLDFSPDARAQVIIDNLTHNKTPDELNKLLAPAVYDRYTGNQLTRGGRDGLVFLKSRERGSNALRRWLDNAAIDRAASGNLHTYTDAGGIQRVRLLPRNTLRGNIASIGQNMAGLGVNVGAYAAAGTAADYLVRTVKANLPSSKSTADTKALGELYKQVGAGLSNAKKVLE